MAYGSPPPTRPAEHTGADRRGARDETEVLLLGWPREGREALRRLAGQSLPLAAVEEVEALELAARGRAPVLCLGEELPGGRALAFLERLPVPAEGPGPVVLVLAGGRDLAQFRDLVSRDEIYYLTQEPVIDADLVAILERAVEQARGRSRGRGEADGEAPHVLQTIVEVARRVALQRDLDSAGELTREAIREVLGADRAYALVYDEDHQVLWSGEPGSRSYREESAAVGMVSFVARTGRALLKDQADQDPRFEREADDPEGTGGERFLAVPVQGASRRVLAVLVAVRSGAAAPFSHRDLAHLEVLADQVASVFSQLGLQASIDKELKRRERELREGVLQVFRDQAVDHVMGGHAAHGPVLRLSPGWARWTYWLLLAILAAAALFLVFGRLREYASGPAVVRFEGSQELTATAASVVTRILVRVGDSVTSGQPLMLFYGAQELAELNRIEREFELQLLNRLRNPADPSAELALLSLRAQRELARTRLEERTLRAPRAGQVSDLRVQEGQSVGPGAPLLSLAAGTALPTVWALLPGHFRPLLAPGMDLRFEVQGYEYAYLHLAVDSVSGEIVGPAEARRYLGPVLGDVVAVAGPVVLVKARLEQDVFEAGGRTYAFHDGLYGRAEVAVRDDRILLSLFPRFKVLTEGWGAGG